MGSEASSESAFVALAADIKRWGVELGFQEVGIGDVALDEERQQLAEWLAKGYHGSMDYMARYDRGTPDAIVPGTVRIITTRLNYASLAARDSWETIHDPEAAFISRYALGRDYHKVVRGKLQQLGEKIASRADADFQFRVFADSAPVMEVAIARKAGIGWRGKHTLLLHREAGSMFFLGEIYVNLPLPIDAPITEHCGTCQRCIEVCPTQAIIAPYQLDARRCISYLTIEHKGSIPVEFREAMGNRIYGCDDCQLVCPWNKYAQPTAEVDFHVRHGLDRIGVVELWSWTETQWLSRMEGSAIRRIGFERWQRNLAVVSGNALRSTTLASETRANLREALNSARPQASALVAEHIDWALAQR
jgi:epoxyqueuosine reductase